jgi:hypothetical protein
MSDIAALPINLDTGDGIATSAARQKHASGGQTHQMKRQSDTTRPVDQKRERFGSGKPPLTAR